MDEDQYTIGLNYRLLNNSSAYTSYTRSTRFPVLDEFFSYTDNSINSELKEQTSDGFEAGLRIRHESGTAFSVNLFRFETEDEIIYNPYNADNIYGANDNLDGDTVRQGVELTISHAFDNLLLTGSYTYRDTEIKGGRYDGKEIPNVPEHQWTLGAQKTFGSRVQLGLNGTYVGERRFISDFNNDFDMLDDYFFVTSKLSYLLENGSLYVAVNNLLNEEYSEYGVLSLPITTAEEGFYPSPKINFVVGAELRF
jgi:iron complex outermembrane receptor protein